MTLSRFLAIELPTEPVGSEWCVLTPRLMQWGERIWLMDLSVTLGYWQVRAESQGVDALTLVREILDKIFGTKPPIYRAAMASHPWQALLLLTQLAERKLGGLVVAESQLGGSIFQQLSWSSWFHLAEHIGRHLLAVKTPRFNLDHHRRNLKLMEASMARLRMGYPWQLKTATDQAMRRRFGATLALLWAWTYGTYNTYSSQPHLSGLDFPWISWLPPELPRVTRHLDFAVWQWDAVAPFLVQDFDRLCRLPSWHAQERITRIGWHLTLDDLSVVEVPICFRHPHGLHKEIGHHKTSILQANYAFADVVARVTERLALGNLETTQPVVGWSLTIEERLTVPPAARDLFGDIHSSDDSSEQADLLDLLELENQLPVELARYDLRADWLPEDSFAREISRHPSGLVDEGSEPWRRIARHRPLFLYEKAIAFDTDGSGLERSFLERMACKWWLTPNRSSGHRDYYRLKDHSSRAQWVYQDSAGKWFVHGIFA